MSTKVKTSHAIRKGMKFQVIQAKIWANNPRKIFQVVGPKTSKRAKAGIMRLRKSGRLVAKDKEGNEIPGYLKTVNNPRKRYSRPRFVETKKLPKRVTQNVYEKVKHFSVI